MQTAIIAIGSNLGASPQTIASALAYWEERWNQEVRVSPLYRSEPMYDTDQPAYVNAVFRTTWHAGPFSLLGALLETESRFGRVRDPSRRFGARSIDLDLIDMSGHTMRTDILTLPHPRMQERPFVLRPLADIAPEWSHPITGRNVGDLLRAALEEAADVQPLGDENDPKREHI